jgi:glycerol-3-phosphate dehydrogenase (NAD(P)+)
VELGGALKNIIAIAAGVCDGLGFGDNSKAALITRGIAEMRRLGAACGAQPETFAGLSGIGDLTLTCFSRQSRNRELGERIGRGETMAQITKEKGKLAEGYPTARSAQQLAQKLEVQTPIIDEVYAMLYEGKNSGRAVTDLLSRDIKAED